MRGPRRVPRDDRGESLVEILVAVTIMAIAVPAIVGSVLVGVMMADIHRKQATAGAAARSYAEQIESYVDTQTALPTSATGYSSAVPFPALPGYSATISMLCWSSAQFGTSCPSGTTVEELTIQVASNDQRAREQLTIVVRRP